VAGAIEDQFSDADREVGVIDLDIVIATGRKDVRSERFEVDEQGLDVRPGLFELSCPLFRRSGSGRQARPQISCPAT
jgi:hypothetical protein